MMLGAIAGDIIGSRFEFSGNKNKDFELFTDYNFFTDDTVMTCAVAQALLKCNGDYSQLSKKVVLYMQKLGRKYDGRGYGENFLNWIYQDCPGPYYSLGNGSAMRISPVAYVAKTLEEVKYLSREVTKVSHNHSEGIKGAESVAVAIWLANNGKNKEEIREYIEKNYYTIDDNYDNLPISFCFDTTCPGTVPKCFYSFFNSDSFEESVRTAVAFGGDADTMGAITGSIAGAYYGIPKEIQTKAKRYLDDYLRGIVNKFNKKYGVKR